MHFLKAFRQTKFLQYAVSVRNVFTDCGCVEELKKRTILKLSGPDTNHYLQNMITNDVKRVENFPSVYTLFLNSRGRVLYDIILYKVCDNEYLVEYDKTAVEYLHKHLLMYRMRKDVKIQPVTDILPWVIYPDVNKISLLFEGESLVKTLSDLNDIVAIVNDPRSDYLGIRVLTKKNTNLSALLTNKSINCIESNSYTLLRYKLGIGEGVLDHPPGNCLPFETNVDFLNGISFDKGCYIGQELTAKSHFVLNVRKRLVPVVLEPMNSYPVFPPECTIVDEKGQKLGRLRSHFGQYGLALLKYEECSKSELLKVKEQDIKLKYIKPVWWPNSVNKS